MKLKNKLVVIVILAIALIAGFIALKGCGNRTAVASVAAEVK